jgi:hypothetical protein
MTAQIPDILLFNGEELPLASEPLRSWLSEHPDLPPFMGGGTSLMRGYRARWAIEGRCLMLLDIAARFESGAPVTLQDLFPMSNPGEPVFARWVQGHLRCNRGALLEYVHLGYASRYEEDVLFLVLAGSVHHVHYVEN